MKAVGELAAIFAGLALAPLGPVLGVTALDWPWEAVAMASLWAPCWYIWLWMKTREKEEE